MTIVAYYLPFTYYYLHFYISSADTDVWCFLLFYLQAKMSALRIVSHNPTGRLPYNFQTPFMCLLTIPANVI